MPISIYGDGSIGPLSATEVGYLDGLTSAVQTQLDGKLATPGAWSSYTPSVSGITLGNGTVTGSYVQVGKLVVARVTFKMGSTSSVTGGMSFTLPIAAATYTTDNNASGSVYFEDAGTAGYFGVALINSGGTTVSFSVASANGTYAGSVATSSTIPFSWGTNDFANSTFSYQTA